MRQRRPGGRHVGAPRGIRSDERCRSIWFGEASAANAAQAERRTFRALGDELVAVAGRLERASALAGQRNDPRVGNLVQQARDPRARMDNGDEMAAEESQRLLDEMGAASERLVFRVEDR